MEPSEKSLRNEVKSLVNMSGSYHTILRPFSEHLEEEGYSLEQVLSILRDLFEIIPFMGITSTRYAVVIKEAEWRDRGCEFNQEEGGYRIGDRKGVREAECLLFDWLEDKYRLIENLRIRQDKLVKEKRGYKPPARRERTQEEKRISKEDRKIEVSRMKLRYNDFIQSIETTKRAPEAEFLQLWARKINNGVKIPFSENKLDEYTFYVRWVPLFIDSEARIFEIERAVRTLKDNPMAVWMRASRRTPKGVIGYMDQYQQIIAKDDAPEPGVWGFRTSLPLVLYYNFYSDKYMGTNYTQKQKDQSAIAQAIRQKTYETGPRPARPEISPVTLQIREQARREREIERNERAEKQAWEGRYSNPDIDPIMRYPARLFQWVTMLESPSSVLNRYQVEQALGGAEEIQELIDDANAIRALILEPMHRFGGRASAVKDFLFSQIPDQIGTLQRLAESIPPSIQSYIGYVNDELSLLLNRAVRPGVMTDEQIEQDTERALQLQDVLNRLYLFLRETREFLYEVSLWQGAVEKERYRRQRRHR